jgi:hypothetical protein
MFETQRRLRALLPDIPRVSCGGADYYSVISAKCELPDGRRLYVPADGDKPAAEIAEELARRVRAIIKTGIDPAPRHIPPEVGGAGYEAYMSWILDPERNKRIRIG